MKLTAVVAMSKNRAIGKDNQLLWHLPDDLKHFKNLTLNKTVLMGRKTYESIGKALPKRLNIVFSQNPDFKASDCLVVHTLEEALRHTTSEEEVFLIGGAMLYEQLLPKITRIYLTLIDADLPGDAFFPEISLSEWQEVENNFHPKDEKHAYAFHFITLNRI